MSDRRPVRVEPRDLATLPARENDHQIHQLLLSVLWQPSWTHFRYARMASDIRGLSTLVSYTENPGGPDAYVMLAVANAAGRVHLTPPLDTVRQARLQAGVTVLGGEIAARTIRALITADGAHGLGAPQSLVEALDDVIEDLWPRHDHDPRDPAGREPGHLGARLSRMLRGPAGRAFTPAQTRALGALARTYNPDTSYLGMARCAAETARMMPGIQHTLARTRDDVLTERFGRQAATGTAEATR
ncbi:hypothetical protein AB0465_37335 [Streptomyces griseoviridis]|uniref:hypothetical protein n=1 Tax=Streptomyces griseoviridis TaxID=45398 RepID=UPI0033E3B64F